MALRFVIRSPGRLLIPLAILLLLHGWPVQAATHVGIAPIPAEVRSDYFVVTINGHATPVVHAASSYYLLNFDLDGAATVSIRAADAHYWDRGVEVQPMRYGIRPHRSGATITFRIPGPVKLSLARPGDHFADAQMLFLLGSAPDRSGVTAATAGVRYYAPGVHHEDIEAHSGDRIYLAPGAVVFGSLNLWQVENVRVFGRGMIIYDGPQDPGGDQGWMHQRAWHCIVMDRAHDIGIEGITCIVRSRTWQIQMKDSRGIGFFNVNVIGGHPRDANQDGLDWLGGGDTTVRDCFIRASDDVFAMEGNWDGYTDADMRIPGHDVTNVTIEDSVVSNSISNTVRVGWPKKTFRSAHVILRNLDVLHTGYGGCVVPFAFFEMWDDQGAVESHSDFQISNIRLEDYYSLLQIRQPDSTVRDIHFSNISAMDGPPMVPSVLTGGVSGVDLSGVRVLGSVASANAAIPLDLAGGASQPSYEPGAVDASFAYAPGLVQPGQPVSFRVLAPAEGWHYQWLFGDGATAQGANVRHAFPDADGTLLDGSGRFRVLLRAWKPASDDVWASRSVVVARSALPSATPPEATAPGLTASSLANRQGLAWDGWLRVPSDGGYTLTLVTSLRATVTIDDLSPVHSPELRLQVCGFFGDAVQPTRQSVALRSGLHRLHIQLSSGIENAPVGHDGAPVLYWEGPNQPLQPIPADALLHAPAGN